VRLIEEHKMINLSQSRVSIGFFIYRWRKIFACGNFRYSGCQKNVPVFERFFLQPYTRLCRVSVIRNIIMKSGIKYKIDLRDLTDATK
jgi:hypothetical protein